MATASVVQTLLGPDLPDVVHLHHGYSLPDAAAIARSLGCPLVVSFWGYDATALPLREPRRILDHARQIDLALVPSRFLAERVTALGVAADRIRTIPASVDVRYFAPSPVPIQPRVAFVGRFVPKKGIDILLEAWPRVRRAEPEAQLTILGFGGPAPRSDPGAGIRVLFTDPIDPRAQVRSLIRACRVYVAPSRTAPDGDAESQHVGNLEAQASGRPVVTTDHAALPEFVRHGINGYLVPQADAKALAEALIVLLHNHAECARLGEAGVTWASSLDVASAAARYDEIYRDLAAA
jgi:glycosyltransferase involved in cell wall biosynthesis